MEFMFVKFGMLPSAFYALSAGERLVLHTLVQRWAERRETR